MWWNIVQWWHAARRMTIMELQSFLHGCMQLLLLLQLFTQRQDLHWREQAETRKDFQQKMSKLGSSSIVLPHSPGASANYKCIIFFRHLKNESHHGDILSCEMEERGRKSDWLTSSSSSVRTNNCWRELLLFLVASWITKPSSESTTCSCHHPKVHKTHHEKHKTIDLCQKHWAQKQQHIHQWVQAESKTTGSLKLLELLFCSSNWSNSSWNFFNHQSWPHNQTGKSNFCFLIWLDSSVKSLCFGAPREVFQVGFFWGGGCCFCCCTSGIGDGGRKEKELAME